nr:hypothetical protein [Burkholderia anthina]
MKHRVAVRAYRPKIGNRIDLVFLFDLRQWSQVMYVNEAFTEGTVLRAEIESADNTHRPPVLDTLSPSFGISLVPIYRYLFDAPFAILTCGGIL